MATQMTINNIGGLWVKSVAPRFARASAGIAIPGGQSQVYATGNEPVGFTVEGAIGDAATSNATSKTKATQLSELAENHAGYPFVYIQFPGQLNRLDGFYHLESVDFTENYRTLQVYPFTMSVRRIATLASHRLATRWSASAESYSGWSSLTANNLVTLPYVVTNPDFAISATRTSADGSNQIMLNPTRQVATYKSSATIANWYLSECKIYDTVQAGETNSTSWRQVFSTSHVFGGDIVVQNGLLRAIIGSATTFYVWDTVSTTNAWVSIGALATALTGNLAATISYPEVLKINPDEIQWKEWRQNGNNPILLTYSMRRGSYFVRVKIETFALGVDTGTYINLAKASGYTELFNSAANGAAGGGNLALDATNHYAAGFSTSANVIGGFALTEQPASQPLDPGAAGNSFPLSLTYSTGDSGVFFVVGFPASTNLLSNVGFETAGAGGADVFGSWDESAGDGAIAQDATTKHGGTYSAKLTAGATVNTALYQAVDASASTKYLVSFWTRGDGVSAGRYQIIDNIGELVTITSTGVTGATWTRVGAMVTTNAGATVIQLTLRCSATVAGVAYFDDCIVNAAPHSALAIAQQALKNVEQKLILAPRGWYV
jgi:hypothetical protein